MNHRLRPRALPGSLVSALVAVLVCAPLSAQESPGLSFVGGLGWERGALGPSLVEELTDAGFDDPVDRAAVDYPYYGAEGIEIMGMLGFRYRFDSPFFMEAVVSNGERGRARGYREEDRYELIVSYASFLLTATGGAELGPFRFEAGPILNGTSWGKNRNDIVVGSARTASLGALAGVGLSLDLPEVLLSLRAGVRAFPEVSLSNSLELPVQVGYRSMYVAVSFAGRAD